MAKFVLACTRDGRPIPQERIEGVCALLLPDNLPRIPAETRTRGGLTLAVANPTPAVPLRDTALCLGQLFGASGAWWQPESPVPDGSFAMVRADDARVELVTDAVGSRSVYYALTDRLFVASSSQRAVVALVGGFELNPEAVSWMISAGVLGPGLSWDRRVVRLGADARVLLDRRSWTLRASHRPVTFRPEHGREKEHAAMLEEAVRSVFDGLDLGGARWSVPLSGGHDSRLILLSLARRYPRIPSVTWGVQASLDDPRNDAHVAAALARQVGVPHEYRAMDLSPEPVEVLFDRFLTNGDGAVDNMGAYMDGFEVWRQLHERGVAGVVRGDEGFGWEPVAFEATVRFTLGATMLRDFYTAAEIEALGVAPQPWPLELERGSRESLAAWRDRLYHAFRIPVVLASLTDLKTSYVEVLNPLLARRILEVVRRMTDGERTDKRLFRELVESVSPPIPFATRSAIPSIRELVNDGAMRALARRELIAGRDERTLPAPFVDHLLAQLPASGGASRFVATGGSRRSMRGLVVKAIKSVVPPPVRNGIRSLRRAPPPPGELAFRAAIVARMARRLAADGARAPGSRAYASGSSA